MNRIDDKFVRAKRLKARRLDKGRWPRRERPNNERQLRLLAIVTKERT